MPAAAVIPAPVAYIKVVAVKKLVVRTRVRGRVRGPGAAAPSSVVDFGRPCAFPALSAGVNRLHIRHAVLPAKLRGGVVGVSGGFAAEVAWGGSCERRRLRCSGAGVVPARAVKRRCGPTRRFSLSAAASGVHSSSASPSSPKRACVASLRLALSPRASLPLFFPRGGGLLFPSRPPVYPRALLYLPPRLIFASVLRACAVGGFSSKGALDRVSAAAGTFTLKKLECSERAVQACIR